ncbi:MAG: HAD family hydrolase [Actinomycetia bacterium]|nr:HAD family hydrolase [Actinomycetes bacterium]
MIRHVFWDWNGTLLADTLLSVHAVEATLASLGLSIPVTVERWRDVATRPVEVSFRALIGHDLTLPQWHAAEDAYLDAYVAGVAEVGLTPGALDALTRLREAGLSQSIVSLHPQDALEADIARLGVAHHFGTIAGRGPVGSHGGFPDKADLVREQAGLLGVDIGRTVLFGDMVDDATSAHRAGAQGVLVATGDTSRERLVASGFPVVDTLAEAVEWVLARV